MFEGRRRLALYPAYKSIGALGRVGVAGCGAYNQHAVLDGVVEWIQTLGPFVESLPLVLVELAAYCRGEVPEKDGLLRRRVSYEDATSLAMCSALPVADP